MKKKFILILFTVFLFILPSGIWKDLFQHKPNINAPYLENEIIAAAKYFPKEGKHYWGYINEKGEILHDFIYIGASSFHEEVGMAFVKTIDSKIAILDSDLEIISEIDNQEIEDISHFAPAYEQDKHFEDLVPIKLGGKWGYINKDFEIEIEPVFDIAFDFRNGLAEVWFKQSDNTIEAAVINKTGEYILNPTPYAEINLGWDNIYNGYGYEEGNKWGFKKYDGTIVLKPEYDYVYPVADNIVILIHNDKVGFQNLETGFESGLIYEYIDGGGNLLSPRYTDNHSICFYELDDYGSGYTVKLVDFNNQTLITFKAQCFNNQLPTVYDKLMPFQKNGKYGYLSDANRFKIKPQYEYAGRFSENGYALVSKDIGNDIYFFINEKGYRISPYLHYKPAYDAFEEDGYIGATMIDKAYVIFDSNFNLIWTSR